MRNSWVLDVLTDLRSFAEANALPELAEQLDDARLVAARELSLAEARRSREVAQTAIDGRGSDGDDNLYPAG